MHSQESTVELERKAAERNLLRGLRDPKNENVRVGNIECVSTAIARSSQTFTGMGEAKYAS